MSDAKPSPEEGGEAPKKKKSKLPLLLGLVLAAVLGGAGFFATSKGLILAPHDAGAATAEAKPEPLPATDFVPIAPLILSVGPQSRRHLRFTAEVEVASNYREEVEHLMPRIQDVLNSYLRAVDAADLEDPTALVRLRSQMLRRVQVVTGEGRVRDLLITEFVLT